jgi:hypothetical protein
LEEEKAMAKRESSTTFSFLIQVSVEYYFLIIIQIAEKQTWYQPKVDKMKLPQPRMGHSSQVWNGSQIIIYGGWNGF